MTAQNDDTTASPTPMLPSHIVDNDGWLATMELHTADELMFGIFADWGIWPDDHAPDLDGTLGEQFATEIGPDEAVEYWELFELIRHIAHTAYNAGTRN